MRLDFLLVFRDFAVTALDQLAKLFDFLRVGLLLRLRLLLQLFAVRLDLSLQLLEGPLSFPHFLEGLLRLGPAFRRGASGRLRCRLPCLEALFEGRDLSFVIGQFLLLGVELRPLRLQVGFFLIQLARLAEALSQFLDFVLQPRRFLLLLIHGAASPGHLRRQHDFLFLVVLARRDGLGPRGLELVQRLGEILPGALEIPFQLRGALVRLVSGRLPSVRQFRLPSFQLRPRLLDLATRLPDHARFRVELVLGDGEGPFPLVDLLVALVEGGHHGLELGFAFLQRTLFRVDGGPCLAKLFRRRFGVLRGRLGLSEGLDLPLGLFEFDLDLFEVSGGLSRGGGARGLKLFHPSLELRELRILPGDLRALRVGEFAAVRQFPPKLVLPGLRLGLDLADIDLRHDGCFEFLRLLAFSALEGFAGFLSESHRSHSSRRSRIFSYRANFLDCAKVRILSGGRSPSRSSTSFITTLSSSRRRSNSFCCSTSLFRSSMSRSICSSSWTIRLFSSPISESERTVIVDSSFVAGLPPLAFCSSSQRLRSRSTSPPLRA